MFSACIPIPAIIISHFFVVFLILATSFDSSFHTSFLLSSSPDSTYTFAKTVMLPSSVLIDNKIALLVASWWSFTLTALSLLSSKITPSLGLILSSTFPPFLFHFSFLSCSSKPLLNTTYSLLMSDLILLIIFSEIPQAFAALLHLVSLSPECSAASPFFPPISHFPCSVSSPSILVHPLWPLFPAHAWVVNFSVR